MHLAPSTGQPLPQACWQWLRAALSLSPLLALADEVGIDCGLVRQVVRDRAVDLLQLKDLEVLADGFRRLAPAERVDDRIEGHASAGNVVVAVPLLDLVLGHATLILLPLRGAALNTRGIRCFKALRDSEIESRETLFDARPKFETYPSRGANREAFPVPPRIRSASSKLLGPERSNLYRKMRTLGIRPKEG